MKGIRTSTILFGVAALLVATGCMLERWALEAGNQLWLNLAPDIFGSGLLFFVVSIALRLLGKKKKIGIS